MDELEALRESLRKLQSQLRAKQKEKQGYFDVAEEIETIYERMAEDKKLIKGYQSSVRSFYEEEFETFRGKIYSENYKAKIEALLEDYSVVIKNLDTNMDRLNIARAEYENKAYKCNGPIGYLQSSVNSLAHTIGNWFN